MAVNDDELLCSHEVGCRIRILSLDGSELVNFSTLKKARRDLMHAVIPLVPTGLSLFLPVTKTMDLREIYFVARYIGAVREKIDVWGS